MADLSGAGNRENRWLPRRNTLNRYLFSEVLITWAVVVGVLMAIMLATRFASFLAVAAKGELPRDVLGELVALSSLRYLVLLMPASMLIAVILALGRLYSDNEIAAMTGCGVSLMSLFRPFLVLAVSLATLTSVLSFIVGPWAGREADFEVKDAKRLIKYTPFESERFKPLENIHAVFYTTGADKGDGQLGQSFAYIEREDLPSIVTSPHGSQSIDPSSGDRFINLSDGYRYEGTPGNADYEVTRFEVLTLRVSPPAFIYVNNQRKLALTSALLASPDVQDQAEFQGRLAAPIELLLLALLAVPMSHLAPRQGRYSKVVVGLLVYLAYASVLYVAQVWVAHGRVAPWLGLSVIHLLALSIGMWLLAKRQGWLLGKAPAWRLADPAT